MDKNIMIEKIKNLLQEEYSDKKFGEDTQEDVVESIYTVLEELIPQTDYSEEQLSEAINQSVQSVYALSNSSYEDLALFNAMDSAETELQIQFSEDDVENLRSGFCQNQFSEDADIEQEAYNSVYDYLVQNEYSFFPSARETRKMGRDIRRFAEENGVLAKKSPIEKLKLRLGPKRSVVKTAWDTARDITYSPIGKVAVASGVQGVQMKALNKIKSDVDSRRQATYSGVEMVNDLFSESEEVVANRNAEAEARAHEETIAKTQIPLEKAALNNDSQESAGPVQYPENVIPDAKSQENKETATDFIKEVNEHVDLHDSATKPVSFADETFDSIQETYSMIYRPINAAYNTIFKRNKDGRETGESFRRYREDVIGPDQNVRTNARYFGNENGTIGVGTLGTGSEYRSWRANLPKNARGGIKFEANMLTGALVDAITEGMLAGTYYQSLDTGLQVSSGTIKSGYKGMKALITPTLDKAQEKLEKAGNKMANWAMPDGPSAVDIIGMDGKDASEVIKVLDQTNYLNKLPEQARTLFLINLSKSGICYVDEKGTLTKRTIVD